MSEARERKNRVMDYRLEVLTGIRPTGALTVANYIGAVMPIVRFQTQGLSPVVFVADLHAITDNEPNAVKQYIHGIVADCIALGVDPQKTKIYLQSDIEREIATFSAFLSRHISVAELLRVPTLKDKLKKNSAPETVNAFLLMYPVFMAADVLLNKARLVPVGEDQLAHMEIIRLLARRFNKKYGRILPAPKALRIKSIRILSMRGEGKMSKSNPNGAIFLTDNRSAVINKIKSAETAFEGVMSEKLKSHVLLAKKLAKSESEHRKIDSIIRSHKNGKPVMKEFKQMLTHIVLNFLKKFQTKRAKIIRDPSYISSVLKDGKKVAKQNAVETLKEVKKAMYGV